MISNLSLRITKALISRKWIEQDEEELYTYGLFILMSQFLFFLIVLFFGIVFSVLFESVIFYILFRLVRKYAGGYHASSESSCELISSAVIVLCIYIIKLSKSYEITNLVLIISFILSICILILSPLDTKEKPLSQEEYKCFRKISIIILIAIVTIIVLSFIFNFKIIIVPSCLSITLEGILLLLGKIKNLIIDRHIKTNNT